MTFCTDADDRRCDTGCEIGPSHCWNWHRPKHRPDWHDPAACDQHVKVKGLLDATDSAMAAEGVPAETRRRVGMRLLCGDPEGLRAIHRIDEEAQEVITPDSIRLAEVLTGPDDLARTRLLDQIMMPAALERLGGQPREDAARLLADLGPIPGWLDADRAEQLRDGVNAVASTAARQLPGIWEALFNRPDLSGIAGPRICHRTPSGIVVHVKPWCCCPRSRR